jgi:deoxyribonuclease-1
LVCFLSAGTLPATAQNTHIDSFEAAKKLTPQIYADRQEEFYCGYRYSGTAVDLASCGYEPKRDAKRATHLEWEHVVPAEAFGQAFPEWREGHPACVDSKGRRFKGRNYPLFEAWDWEDPVDAWECERDRRIAALQGNHNPFVAAA